MAYYPDDYCSSTLSTSPQASNSAYRDTVFDGKRMRDKAPVRRVVDPGGCIALMVEDRLFKRGFKDRPALQPHSGYSKWLLPPSAYLSTPVTSVMTNFVHLSVNKSRSPVNCLAFSPGGRRCITGSSSGEFTLWNGMAFNFETILQAHDCPIRCMIWSHNENWMITGDSVGQLKYWQNNMNNVKSYRAHTEAIRDVKLCRTDLKHVTCSDDLTIKVWDFYTARQECTLIGHGADVKCVDWHPFNSLIVSGSKDNLTKIRTYPDSSSG